MLGYVKYPDDAIGEVKGAAPAVFAALTIFYVLTLM